MVGAPVVDVYVIRRLCVFFFYFYFFFHPHRLCVTRVCHCKRGRGIICTVRGMQVQSEHGKTWAQENEYVYNNGYIALSQLKKTKEKKTSNGTGIMRIISIWPLLLPIVCFFSGKTMRSLAAKEIMYSPLPSDW